MVYPEKVKGGLFENTQMRICQDSANGATRPERVLPLALVVTRDTRQAQRGARFPFISSSYLILSYSEALKESGL